MVRRHAFTVLSSRRRRCRSNSSKERSHSSRGSCGRSLSACVRFSKPAARRSRDVTSFQIENQVEQAKAGNNAALQIVIESIQDRIYGLALRMLWHPEDARDATQEILIRIVTH